MKLSLCTVYSTELYVRSKKKKKKIIVELNETIDLAQYATLKLCPTGTQHNPILVLVIYLQATLHRLYNFFFCFYDTSIFHTTLDVSIERLGKK